MRRVALQLAQLDPHQDAAKVEKLVQRVWRELRADVRAVVGRHRPYIASLSPKKAEELAKIANVLNNKTPETWSDKAWKDNKKREWLRIRKYGREVARKADELDEDGLAAGSVYVFGTDAAPAYLRSLWRRLDQWGADKHGVRLRTFQSWRRKLQKRGELGERPERPPARRIHRH
jgi:hypothetical protein